MHHPAEYVVHEYAAGRVAGGFRIDRAAEAELVALLVALLVGCGGSALPSATSPGGAAFAVTHHMTFYYTGEKQTFKSPGA
jgi:hypothetical protein